MFGCTVIAARMRKERSVLHAQGRLHGINGF
jgi:hypothetical protein